jgi:hypothetical protein
MSRATVCAAIAMAGASFADAAAVTTIAISGAPAPGTSGALFAGFDTPTINRNGHVAFGGSLEVELAGVTFNDREGYWTGTSGNLTLLGRQSSPVSGAPSYTFTDFLSPVVGPNGNAVVKAYSTGGRGLFGGPAGDVRPIALPGMQAPGFDPGVTFGDQIMGLTINGTPRNNTLGQTAFTANTVGNPAPGSNGGMWCGTAGNLALVTRHGAPAPGLPAGIDIQNFNEAVINDLGQVGFSAVLGGNVDATNNGAVYVGQPGALQTVTRSGDPVPGMSGVTFAGSQFSSSFGMPSINNAGQAAFGGNLAGSGVTSANDNVLVIAAAGSSPVIAAREGDTAPNSPAGVTYTFLGDPHLGGSGHVAFDAGLAGADVTSDTDTAVFTGLPGSIRRLARESDPLPGAADGAQFSFFDSSTINSRGQVAFLAYLKGAGVNFENDTALLAADAGGDLFTIARTGTPLDLGNGDVRIPDSLYYWGYSGGQDGLGSGLSDNGQVVFAADFLDGSSGVFTTTVPEPSAGFAVAIFSLAAIQRRRRLFR